MLLYLSSGLQAYRQIDYHHKNSNSKRWASNWDGWWQDQFDTKSTISGSNKCACYFLTMSIFPPECVGTQNFSGTNFFRYQYWYFFPGTIFSGADTSTNQKVENSRYWYHIFPVRITIVTDFKITLNQYETYTSLKR